MDLCSVTPSLATYNPVEQEEMDPNGGQWPPAQLFVSPSFAELFVQPPPAHLHVAMPDSNSVGALPSPVDPMMVDTLPEGAFKRIADPFEHVEPELVVVWEIEKEGRR